MIERADAVVALAGDFSQQHTIGETTAQRMDTAIGLIKTEVAPHLIVAGSHSFMRRVPHEYTLADLMKEYAVRQGIPEDRIEVENRSFETIGNALLTKTMLTEPNDWKHLIIVTNKSHIPRSEYAFGHVMGPEYSIESVSAGESPARYHRIHELLGNALVKTILKGTAAGDNEAIQERLFGIIPGYVDMPVSKRFFILSTALAAR